MSRDIKLRKAQLAKKIHPGGFIDKTLGNLMGNVRKRSLVDLTVPLAKKLFPTLASKATLSVLDKFERKVGDRGAVTAGKGLNLFISN